MSSAGELGAGPRAPAGQPDRRLLRAKAISLLAQREHSAQELRSKLLRHALALCDTQSDEREVRTGCESLVDELLQWLQAQGYLDEQRFIESRLHVRASRFGNQRIRQELSRHGLTLSNEQHAQLNDTELTRAREVRVRKFGDGLPVDAQQRLKQMRFLAGRGFAADTIRRVLEADD